MGRPFAFRIFVSFSALSGDSTTNDGDQSVLVASIFDDKSCAPRKGQTGGIVGVNTGADFFNLLAGPHYESS